MLLKICGSLIFLFTVVNGLARIDPLVSTDVGLIRGLRAEDGDYSMFLGIPFAQVDADNPFGAATPYPEFENTFLAYDDSVVCPQVEEFNNSIVGSLDCLNLNVFVPVSATSNNRLPVLVWIYGGGFSFGFNNRYLYGPRYLVQHDIILVTVNYRLGPYGFMCLDKPEIPGNQGLKDQLLALRWINRNIGAFGGDANKITIYGESAGAMSVDLHLLSNGEKLYDKAILQSGNSLVPTFYEPLRTAPVTLAEYLGFPTDNIDEALDFLAKTDTRLVIAAVTALGLNANFKPCIENDYDGVENFITQNWIKTTVPKVRNVPILIGFNSDEQYGSYTSDDDQYYQSLDLIHTNLAIGFDVNDEEFQNMEDIVRHFYFGDEPINAAAKQSASDFHSDFKFVHPTLRAISRYLDNSAGNIFLYVFSHVGERNFVRQKNKITSGTGALHADEIGYLFDISYWKNVEVTPEDQLVIDRITAMWTNFVKFGNPTPQTSDVLPLQWTPITSHSELPYLEIGSQLTSRARPISQRTTFWDLFYKTNEHLQILYPGAKVDLK